ncbi:MAG TPA: hypothetical protein PK079_23710 [Leptospiraceae bacterium]|nr:hypothetical protein [Leptospiraceae bacterium]HMX35602.1 hypothetical protein [Leptospiraceae bacterium]HNA10461.1 hypothetical protein [Leptospiraceae bacterium]HNE56190.1 hypothetical protein [Leptospiraceae bacterium]HNM91909.1 hypothetical protein [Leptospiraceae bacterium]
MESFLSLQAYRLGSGEIKRSSIRYSVKQCSMISLAFIGNELVGKDLVRESNKNAR